MAFEVCSKLGDASSLYQLRSIGPNGDATISQITWQGKPEDATQPIACKDLIEKFSISKSGLPQHADFPNNRSQTCESWTESLSLYKIMHSLDILSRKIGVPSVLCRDSPIKSVFATEKYAANALLLVPTTQRIKAVDKSLKDDVTTSLNVSHQGELNPKNSVFVLLPAANFVSPAFYVQANIDPDKCNMKVVSKPIDPTTKCEEKRAVLKIPVLTNTKALEIGVVDSHGSSF